MRMHSPTRLLFLVGAEEFLDAADRAEQVSGLIRQVNRLGLVTAGDSVQHLDVLLSQQVVGGIGALPYCLGNLVDGDSLGFGLADAGLGLTFGTQNLGLLVGLGLVDAGGLLTLGLEDGGLFLTLAGKDGSTLVTLGLHPQG